MTESAPPVHRWLARVAPEPGHPGWLIAVFNHDHPNEAVVDLTAAEAPAATVGWRTAAAIVGDRVVGLRVAEAVAPKAPPLWFAEIRESRLTPPAVNLVAFTGHGPPTGVLYDEGDLSNVAVGTADQLGALRWYPGSGEVDQVYVDPAHRLTGVGTVVVHAAAILAVARGWPLLWGDGQRTALGEEFRNASHWKHRTAELTHLTPPMTPGDPGAPPVSGRPA